MAFQSQYSFDQTKTDKPWLDLQYHDSGKTLIKKPNELENEMQEPPGLIDEKILDRIQGSMIGMALGDALGAHVEFRPRQYMIENPVTDLEAGGTWGLRKGQFTDDTSMALCLANSLVVQSKFNPYDQLVRYKWWYRYGYMSSTGECFDIGAATSQSLEEFERRQYKFAKKIGIKLEDMDSLSDPEILKVFNEYCSEDQVAGNGALMRLGPVPLFFHRSPEYAVEYSGHSGQITHGDRKAYDACRYYGALIVAALHGYKKDQLLDRDFYSKHHSWFNGKPLCTEIKLIAEGSYKKAGGYDDGIRGKGYIVDALEAALWAFWSDGGSFEKGALAAVNLGDDTDTTAAIYGQLAGAYYGYRKLPKPWLKRVYARKFIINLSQWIAYEGQMWQPPEITSSSNQNSFSQSPPYEKITEKPEHELDLNMQALQSKSPVPVFSPSENREKSTSRKHLRRRNRGPPPSESSQYQPIAMEPPPTNQTPLNPNYKDSYSKYPSDPVCLDPHLALEKSNPNKQKSPTLQSNISPFNSSENSETLSPGNSSYGPPLRGTHSISSSVQVFPSSAYIRNHGTVIDHNKQSSSSFETSSHTQNDKMLLKKTSSESYPSKTTQLSVPSAKIPEPVSPTLPTSNNSRSGHRFSNAINGIRGHSKQSTPSAQISSTSFNESTPSRVTVLKGSSAKAIKQDQKQQLSIKNRPPQTIGSLTNQISSDGLTQSKSSSQSFNKTSGKDYTYI